MTLQDTDIRYQQCITQCLKSMDQWQAKMPVGEAKKTRVLGAHIIIYVLHEAKRVTLSRKSRWSPHKRNSWSMQSRVRDDATIGVERTRGCQLKLNEPRRVTWKIMAESPLERQHIRLQTSHWQGSRIHTHKMNDTQMNVWHAKKWRALWKNNLLCWNWPELTPSTGIFPLSTYLYRNNLTAIKNYKFTIKLPLKCKY